MLCGSIVYTITPLLQCAAGAASAKDAKAKERVAAAGATTSAELKKFFNTIQKFGDTQHELMLKLTLYTAVRVNELGNIRVSDVNLDGYKVFIDNGKGSKNRYILFPSDFRLAFAM